MPPPSFLYRGLACQQHPAVPGVMARVLADLRPARVLEIGTAEGGFAPCLRDALDGSGLTAVPVLSYDLVARGGHAAVRAAGVDVRVQPVFGPSHRAVDARVAEYVRSPGPSLVLCDGGQKIKEFAALAPLLKTGDVIGAHDYAPNWDHFVRHVRGRTWDRLAFTDAAAVGPAATCGLTSWRPDDLGPVNWLWMRKTAAGRPALAPHPSGVTVCLATIPPRRTLLLRALESVASQTVRPEAVVVVCDYGREGAARTKTRTLEQVRTQWVTFLDDDDQMFPHHVELLLNHARASGADVAYSSAEVVAPDGRVLPNAEGWGRYGLPFDAQRLREISYIQTPALMRTERARSVGGFAAIGDSPHDEWNMYRAILDAGGTFSHLPRRTWRWHHWGGNTGGKAP
ncbi:glycosyltransferase [Frigoriglobus tundricola]|uniref:Glycosyltransferase 2-like domain-containing protein n=1 Tax=Frigoriglobus tundricola TaxID=2774151 RepID=A0A6M5Z6R9_9BACT|nr:glycosyltransferase [Frigoriglobus tundricola]QJX01322.1 hypothetical protein FTUN_8966 [Frigoriglobus tundricola]